MASVDLDPVPGTPVACPVYPDPDSWVTDDDIGSDDEDPELVTKPSVTIKKNPKEFAARSAAIRALGRYPRVSAVVTSPPCTRWPRLPADDCDGILSRTFPRKERELFARSLDDIDPRIRAKMDQPFGKDNLTQCFYAEPTLRHVLLPLWKSGYLGDLSSWRHFARAFPPCSSFLDLVLDYGEVDFDDLRGYPDGWDAETAVNTDRVRMTTAALLHFDGSAADLVRWVGGPHVAAHRDSRAIIDLLRRSEVDPPVVEALETTFLHGFPHHCNVSATEANFQAYYQYGNHASVDEDPEKTYKAMVKASKKGYILVFDERLIPFLLNCHVTPQGLVDLNTLYKNPRPIFDSTFRPYPWCHAINDWTSKDTEPPLTFATAEMEFMIWLYNLRVSYPWLEIFIGDDDVSGAFNQNKMHPNLVAMHTSRQCGFGVLSTGTTFGGNTSPSGWDSVKCARQQRSIYIWKHEPTTWLRAKQVLPPLELSADPTPLEVAGFVPADADTLNRGVMAADGSRLPPTYPMHVDDNMYADVKEFLPRTVCSSAAGLYDVLGWPQPSIVPSPLSMDKLKTQYNHVRKAVGRLFNSRTLSVGMLPYKRVQLIATLRTWQSKADFDILELASLLGQLDNHTRYARWARAWYFGLQNGMRRCLKQRFHVLSRFRKRLADKAMDYSRQLPPSLAKRLSSLLARDQAALLWSSRCRFKATAEIRGCVAVLLHYVLAHEDPWNTPLGLIIPRDWHVESYGDACTGIGGGAFSIGLAFWFDVKWSKRVTDGCLLKAHQPGYIHINALEFIVVILQLAAIVVRMESLTPEQAARFFPNGVPRYLVWLGWTDNMVSRSWESRATSSSLQGQALLAVYSELLRMAQVNTICKHVPGDRNVCADDISRNDFSLSFSSRLAKLTVNHSALSSLEYFLPSPDLLQLLSSQLFSGPVAEPCKLPKTLGQLVPAGCTTSGLPVI